MNIETVKANTKGGYDVTFEGGETHSLSLAGDMPDTPETAVLAAWLRAGNRAAPYQPSLDKSKVQAAAQVERQFSTLMVSLTGNASIEERDTWSIKEAAARAFEAGNANESQLAMLTAEANGVGETVAELASKIITKATGFYALVGFASGLKRDAHLSIEAATDLADLGAVLSDIAAKRDAALAAFSS